MKRFCQLLGLPLFLLTLALLIPVGIVQADQKADKSAEKPHIDLVICLDTSGSMNGLIESAKVKLWDIVNELSRAEPTPQLRIALFTYGSPHYGKQSGWVHKNLGFTTDLDKVYEKLFALKTNGGTEYVARVSQAALDQLKWSEEEKTLRLIFVCGNESAAQDPLIKLDEVAQQAVKRNIFINTIHCRRPNAREAEIVSWKKLASLAEGRFVSIDQNRGTVAVKTPLDKKLAELGRKLNKTYVWYGYAGKLRQANQLAQDANALKLGTGVAAKRAKSKSSEFYRMPTACLVDRFITDPKFDITKIPEKDLPDNLKKMNNKERLKYLKDAKEKRETLQKEINELSKQRDEYVREHLKKNQNQADVALDEAIRSTLQTQAKVQGITIPKE